MLMLRSRHDEEVSRLNDKASKSICLLWDEKEAHKATQKTLIHARIANEQLRTERKELSILRETVKYLRDKCDDKERVIQLYKTQIKEVG